MRTGASLGWRIATAVAFGATAALAVTLSRGVPLNAALTSAKGSGAQHRGGQRPAAGGDRAVRGVRAAHLPGPGARVSAAITRYPLDFTNVSGASCTLAGYPEVAAYRGNGVQVGAAAGDDLSAAARRVLLAPGQTAHATLDASVPTARCGPVHAAGLRVVTPGQAAARYVRRPLTACDRPRVAPGRAGVPAGSAPSRPGAGPPDCDQTGRLKARGLPLLTRARTGKW